MGHPEELLKPRLDDGEPAGATLRPRAAVTVRRGLDDGQGSAQLCALLPTQSHDAHSFTAPGNSLADAFSLRSWTTTLTSSSVFRA